MGKITSKGNLEAARLMEKAAKAEAAGNLEEASRLYKEAAQTLVQAQKEQTPR